MGVPALFRWLSKKYPKIISPVVEAESSAEYGRVPAYADANPNGELDNLYLDMNGIVHPCSHPEHKAAPETEDEMFLDVFRYTERVLMMARPRKVLMIAVDGVAPRAKMNQQRARRFRAAADAKAQNEANERQARDAEARGEAIDVAIAKRKWDSNAITPGTPFMDGLAAALRYWVAYKLATDGGWRDLQVIISDATVPGEGEHKIMSFIRLQRLDPLHDANTTHCIYGLDADLIFLGLATHEPHFRVLREDVFARDGSSRPFLWLHVNVLREYLEAELRVPMQPRWDLERAIDDWVFMCFFVGNDFLPHLPSLSVRDNGIDILLGCWKQVIAASDYLTCDGALNLAAVELLMRVLTPKEDGIFRRRFEREQRFENSTKRRKVALENEKHTRRQFSATVSKGKERAPLTADPTMPLMDTAGNLVEGYAAMSNRDIVHGLGDITKALSNKDAADRMRGLLGEAKAPEKREAEDPVRNHEAGYRERYYASKFGAALAQQIDEARKNVVRLYLEGIAWVLLYYYQGCPLWQWYFPYHYAPFAADFTNLAEIVGDAGITFDEGVPFRPYEQLMSVLPAASGHTLPAVFRDLMSNPDSEIIDFYPETFEIDMNGAKMSWQGIALLPFIDEKRLLAAVQAKYPLLTDYERERNTNKTAQLFILKDNKNYLRFTEAETAFTAVKTGLAGVVKPVSAFNSADVFTFPLKEGDMPDIAKSEYLQIWYDFPKTQRGKSMLLHGYISHDRVLDELDIQLTQNPNQRFNNFQNTSVYVNNGPSGREPFRVYSMRPGGYRSLIAGPPKAAPKPKFQNTQDYSLEYGVPFGQNRNQGYRRNGQGGPGQGQRYNQGYGNQSQGGFQGGHQGGNQGGHQGGHQGGYQGGNQGGYQGYENQSYGNRGNGNQGYANQGYRNQGYGNQGYGNQGYQGGNGYGNQSRYLNRGHSYQNQHGNQGNGNQGNYNGNQYGSRNGYDFQNGPGFYKQGENDKPRELNGYSRR